MARDGYKTEWWYFTGHLRTAEKPARRFGFQFTFFRIGVSRETPEAGSAWSATRGDEALVQEREWTTGKRQRQGFG